LSCSKLSLVTQFGVQRKLGDELREAFVERSKKGASLWERRGAAKFESAGPRNLSGSHGGGPRHGRHTSKNRDPRSRRGALRTPAGELSSFFVTSHASKHSYMYCKPIRVLNYPSHRSAKKKK
jgi:hypothetical protein